MKQVYAPGCALMLYKPELARKVLALLNQDSHIIPELTSCCRHKPDLEDGTQVINTCAGCDKRYGERYKGISTVSLWEILAESDSFPFPNYHDTEMTIQDACPTRQNERVHQAIRRLLERMNIKVVEPEHTRTGATCCGDSFYGVLPVEKVQEQMKKRSDEMPCHDVVVYCVSCIKAFHIGGKQPRYALDLLFGEKTLAGIFNPDEWHKELKAYIDKH